MRVNTNDTEYIFSIETAVGVAGTLWRQIVLNDIGAYGPQLTTAESRPISRNRARNKGSVVDLDSTFEFEADLTMQHLIDFVPCFLFGNFRGPVTRNPTSVATGTYTLATASTPAVNSLVVGKGFANAENNGLKVVTASTATTIDAAGLVAEASPPSEAVVDFAGFRTAVGDLDVNADGNLTSTALDFTTLPIEAGQWIVIGGEAAINRFTNEENRGRARVVSVSANLLVLSHREQAFVTEANTAQLVDLYIPRHCTQVPVGDTDFLKQSLQVEAFFPSLGNNPTSDQFWYSLGNYCDTLTLNFPGQALTGVSFGFIGTDTSPPTATRKTNAELAIPALQTKVFNTSSDFVRLRMQDLDELGISTSFKEMEITLTNNVSALKCIGVLGAVDANIGIFTVDLSGQVLFDDPGVLAAIRNNDTVSLDFSMKNDDGGWILNIPAFSLGGGDLELPQDDTARLNVTGQAFLDTVLDTSIIIDVFGFYPTFP